MPGRPFGRARRRGAAGRQADAPERKPIARTAPDNAGTRAGGPRELWLRAFAPFAFGYLVAHLLRSVTAVAGPGIAADLGLSPAQLGFLASAYFLGYGAMQVPVGILLDRFGPRRTEAGLLLVGALGAALFALAAGTFQLGLGRALVGVGFSACLLAGYKANALWFPAERLPFMNGVLMACGGAGGALATTPAGLFIGLAGWRTLFLLLAALTLVAAAVIRWTAPERNPAGGGGGGGTGAGVPTRTALPAIARDRLFRRVAPVVVLTQAVWLAYLSLWAGPWLADVAGLGPLAVANHLLALSIGVLVGFFVQGALAQALLARYGVAPLRTMAAGTIGFLLAQGALAAGWIAFALPGWSLFGLFGAVTIIGYAVLAQHFPQAIVGRATAVLNFLVFGLAFALQAGIGVLVEAAGPDPATGQQQALRLLLVLQAAAWVWLVWPQRRSRR